MAVAAGPDSIEHGTFASADLVAGMADRGIALTPTVGAVLGPLPEDAPAAARERSARARDAVDGLVRHAWEAGVTLLAGTDAELPHGQIRREIELLTARGVSPHAALGAGSWTARRFLGLPGIEEGAAADLVAFRRDPREDLAVLAEPSLIVLAGRVTRPFGTRPT